MARIRGYIAASLDGYIADAEGRLDWLFAYNDMDLGEHHYDRFIEEIRTVVMGRRTYDFLADSGMPWAYGGKRVIVVTSRPIEAPVADLETRDDVDALVRELRSLDDGDVWMLGGGQLQMAFIDRDALDDIEVYIMPELLGGGAPLFPAAGVRRSPRLIAAKALDRGCVRVAYALS